MEKDALFCRVVMERVPTSNRWQSFSWRVAEVVVDESADVVAGEAVEREDLPGGILRTTYRGLPLKLFRDEGEGYFLNIQSPEPSIFVIWRWNEDESDAIPHMLTLSYNEAARWLDSQENVERVPMPEMLFQAVSTWVANNYDPPRKKERIRPKSFESKEGRYKSGM
jgi:hypothetical protein